MLLAGMAMGTVAFLMAILEDHLNLARAKVADNWIASSYGEDDRSFWVGMSYLYFTSFGVILILISCLMTIYIAPAAAGSGVAEIIAMLNGINYPGIIAP